MKQDLRADVEGEHDVVDLEGEPHREGDQQEVAQVVQPRREVVRLQSQLRQQVEHAESERSYMMFIRTRQKVWCMYFSREASTMVRMPMMKVLRPASLRVGLLKGSFSGFFCTHS